MPSFVVNCRKLIDAELLRRSSQVVSVAGGSVYIFGGELHPREPRDNDVHMITLDRSEWPAVINSQDSYLRGRHYDYYPARYDPVSVLPCRNRVGDLERKDLPLLRPGRARHGPD